MNYRVYGNSMWSSRKQIKELQWNLFFLPSWVRSQLAVTPEPVQLCMDMALQLPPAVSHWTSEMDTEAHNSNLFKLKVVPFTL